MPIKKTTKKAKDQVDKMITATHGIDDRMITFQWVKTHNLRDIDVSFPKNQIITITGVSGSGKSSLAFDTIYKEWQFRYIESLSSFLRQFFNLWERPDIEYCSGLSPAIAIEQNKKTGNSRSSVGTITEIDDYLRLLFAKLWEPFCYKCWNEIKPESIQDIMETLKHNYKEKKIYILQESWFFETKTPLMEFVKKNRNRVEKGKGFTRYLIMPNKEEDIKKKKKEIQEPIEYFYLETPNVPDNYFPIHIYGIYDRVTIEDTKLERLKEDIIKILWETKKFGIYAENTKGESPICWFTDKMYCPTCNITYPEFTTQHFSPNRPEWACLKCLGIGEILQVDLAKTLDPESAYDKAILPWRDSNLGQSILLKLAQKYNIEPSKPRKNLPERFQQVVLYWDNEILRIQYSGKFMNISYKWIEDIIKDQYVKWLLTVDFQAMLEMKSCPDCEGNKLRKESLNVFLTIDEENSNNKKYRKYNISDFQKIPLNDLIILIKRHQETADKDKTLLGRITEPLIDRAQTIYDLGLGYITLNRGMDTLSWGEIQRLRLAKQLGNKLTGIIYVLDEPTIGLDDREIKRAITSIKKLKEMGNTIVVVEHNEEFIKASDRIIEIWPGAGDFGWNVVFNGPYTEFEKSNTLTAQYITGKKKVKIDFEHKPSNKIVTIKKASKHNLNNIDVSIKLWSFTVITGPSGAGKTTLMYSTLYRFLNEKNKFVQSYIRLQLLKNGRNRQDILAAPVLHKEKYDHYENLAIQEFYKDIAVDKITGHEEIKNVIYVDQTSIGKTPRSCPATFIWTFDLIRQIFAGINDSKYLWFNASYFSFNSDKGACTGCDGYWYKKIELQFLPDTYIPCELCKGKRYKNEILDIKWKGKNISEILDMYIDDAVELFHEIDNIREDLELMQRIGLWYLKMGQPAHTLSGGESQRLKLVKHLLKSYKGHSVYFLDEPTVGLHMEDISKLLKVIKEFLNKGDTVLMIEHDQNILQYADDIIRLEDGRLEVKHDLSK